MPDLKGCGKIRLHKRNSYKSKKIYGRGGECIPASLAENNEMIAIEK
jgi:hypothetical protein